MDLEKLDKNNSESKLQKEEFHFHYNGPVCSYPEWIMSNLKPEQPENIDAVDELKTQLQELYAKRILPSVSWLERKRDFLLKDCYVTLQLNSGTENKIIQLEEMFTDIDGHAPKRILIEGQPGYGKTTLTNKIVYDWAKREDYLSRFNKAFLISLRRLKGQTLEDAIRAICIESGSQVKFEIEEFNESDTLLLLDGFDELDRKFQDDVLKVLYGKKYSRMCVVVTCRSGLFTCRSGLFGSENEEFQKALIDFGRSPMFYDAKITVAGIGLKEQKRMIEKFCSSEKAAELIEEIEKLPHAISKIFQSPLLLLAVVYFSETNFQSLLKSNLAEVYKSLFNSILKLNISRKGAEVSDDFDLFENSNKASKPYRKELAQFGEICLKKLVQKEFTFHQSELIDEIFSLGLLTKQEQIISSFDSQFYYQSFHLSFLEFAAAYFLWTTFMKKSRFSDWKLLKRLYSFTEHELGALQQILKNSFGRTLVYQFLFELMGAYKQSLLKQLLLRSEALFDHATFWETAAMCIGSKKLLQVMSDKIPAEIKLSTSLTLSLQEFFCSKDFEFVIEQAIQNGRLQCLIVESDAIFHWPKDVTIPYLKVHFDSELKDIREESNHDFRQVRYVKMDYFCSSDFDGLSERNLWIVPSTSHKAENVTAFQQIYLDEVDGSPLLDEVDGHCSPLPRLPLDVTIPKVQKFQISLKVNIEDYSEKDNYHLSQLQCNTLELSIGFPSTTGIEHLFSKLKSFMADRIIIKIAHSKLDLLILSLTEGTLKNSKINVVKMSGISRAKFEFKVGLLELLRWELLSILMRETKIVELQLEMKNCDSSVFKTASPSQPSTLKQLVEMARDCTSLLKLSMKSDECESGNDCPIDFHCLTNGGIRPWKSLSFKNINLFCSVEGCDCLKNSIVSDVQDVGYESLGGHQIYSCNFVDNTGKAAVEIPKLNLTIVPSLD